MAYDTKREQLSVGEMIVRKANVILFGTEKIPGEREKELADFCRRWLGQRDRKRPKGQAANKSSLGGPLDALPKFDPAARVFGEASDDSESPTHSEDGDEGQMWNRGQRGRLTVDDETFQPYAELYSKRREKAEQAATASELGRALTALPVVIAEVKHTVVRETLAGIFAYAKACADRDEPCVLSSSEIERESPNGHRVPIVGVRLGQCLGYGRMGTDQLKQLTEGVVFDTKQRCKTAKKLENFLLEQSDTTIKWKSATKEAIHQRIKRTMPILKAHRLLTDRLFDAEDV